MTRFYGMAVAAAIALSVPATAAAAQASSQAQLEANKKLVLEFYRNVWEPQRLDALKDYYDANFVEHNPNVGQGIEGFANTIGRRWTAKPVQPALQNPPAIVMAEGDLVTLMFKRARPEPGDPSKTYDAWWYDTFRIRNGKIVEHWDPATKGTAPPAGVAPARP